jgi:hypothetical protein
LSGRGRGILEGGGPGGDELEMGGRGESMDVGVAGDKTEGSGGVGQYYPIREEHSKLRNPSRYFTSC